MKILFCNKYNYAFSGTEVYLFQAMDLLRSRGHEAALFSMSDPRGAPTRYDRHFLPRIDFKASNRWWQRIGLAAHAIYSLQARRKLRGMIADFRPDVAHVRNIYHHLSPSILWELKAQKIPVLYHVNDFKLLCPSYNLVSQGEACEACRQGRFWHAVTQNCYPGAGARIALAAEAYVHKWLGTYRNCVDLFLAPSRFVRDKFIEHGWDASRFEVLPHFQALKPKAKPFSANAAVLYFGRLSPEKGVADLLHAMQRLPEIRLIIAGEGPERAQLRRLAADLQLSNVEFAGHQQGRELDRLIADSCFTILPSRAYETFGKTILESYAHGRAVIATDLGSRRELVRPGETGLLYRTGDIEHLAGAIRLLHSQPALSQQMGQAGREYVIQNHSPDTHYAALLDLYDRLRAGVSEKPPEEAARKPDFSRPRLRPAPNQFLPLESLSAPRAIAAGSSFVPSSAKPALKIAFIGGRGLVSKYSGIESYYEQVGEKLARMGHEVTAYCRTYFTPPEEEYHGIKITRLPTIRSKHLETLVHTFLSTIHVMTQPCDLVHYHALGPALFSFFPRLVGKKTVVTVQGLDWQRKKWGTIASAVLRLGEGATAVFPNQTMVVSRTLQQHYQDRHGVETAYVPNGAVIRERRFPRKLYEWGLEPAKYILFLGRFSPEKGCHVLLEAYQRLHTETKLVMAGASSYCDEYSRALRAHQSERIKILDWVSGDDLDELLTNAMIFVLPSELEGLSLALLDAMGAGRCVLASDVPENREVIGAAGFTFARGDVADLAERLRFLLANPAVRQAAGDAARRRAREHYQWQAIAEEIERVYFDVMELELPPAVAQRKPVARETVLHSAQRQTG
ncbi:MAG TPA: glycosyltransferase family 4 protein [Candidatus Binatia bacterium]|nr:glycosyltransferase family 4 protein [Candidatus Binatia bacterium]